MTTTQIFELSKILDSEHFNEVFSLISSKSNQLNEIGEEYIDLSLENKGIVVLFRDSQYKKKIRLIVNTSIAVDDPNDTNKLIRKLDKRLAKYFNNKYRMGDFTLSGMTLSTDIDVGSRANVLDYLKAIKRVGRIKGFSPVSYDFLDGVESFCLAGNSNGIDFLLFDLRGAIINQRRNSGTGRKVLKSLGSRVDSILRAEVRLTKPKAIRLYADEDIVSDQIVELVKNRQQIFLDTFARIIPYGIFYKKDAAMEIIRREVTDNIMRRRMIRLLTLIPEKKSLYLAQKEMRCRDVDKVMKSFVKLNLSPITLSKRHDVKHLDSIYSYL